MCHVKASAICLVTNNNSMTSPGTWLTSSHPIGCFNTGMLFFIVNEEALSKLDGRDSTNLELNNYNTVLVPLKPNLC